VEDQVEEAASQAVDTAANPSPLANTNCELFSAGFTDVTHTDENRKSGGQPSVALFALQDEPN
jgi:hypothetical protein